MILSNSDNLTHGSHIKVLVQCDNPNCNNNNPVQNWIPFHRYLLLIKKSNKYLCFKCACASKESRGKISKSHKGKNLTQKHKDNLSKSHIGLPSSLKGKQLSEEHKRNLRDSSPHLKGKNHSQYNNNLTEQERKTSHSIIGIGLWRKQILEKDNYTCQKCGKTKNETKLFTHHINNFANFKDQRTDINNGITLCKDCHSSKLGKGIHNIYGRFTTKEHYELFFSASLYAV